jgi:hypothetical protein
VAVLSLDTRVLGEKGTQVSGQGIAVGELGTESGWVPVVAKPPGEGVENAPVTDAQLRESRHVDRIGQTRRIPLD